jgi:predicted phage terminase large subunit-like protein
MVQFPPEKMNLNEGDTAALAKLGYATARKDFYAYRKIIRPNMVETWWQRHLAKNLMWFYRQMVAGKRPAMVIMAPPQHGKTEQITDFISWVAGLDPNLRTIFGSYSDELGVKVNLALQRIYDSERYKNVFEFTKINDTNASSTAARWLRNSTILEYVGFEGSFRNTTVMGQINGMGLDLGVIDDPMKGRAEAQSKAMRDKTWAWMTDDFFGRFSDSAGLLMIMTRWHLDDPLGRWVEQFPQTRVLRYTAIAERNERYRKKGEALFPEMKPLEFLGQRKRVLTNAGWQSIYQQSPIAAGGDMFPTEKFVIVSGVDRANIRKSIRYIDKAGTKDGGAYTAATLVHDMRDGTTVIEDCIRGQWSAIEREQRILQAAQTDKAICKRYSVWVEQEPGSGGKESAEGTIRRLKGFDAHADKVTGAKEVRAEPYAAQVQNGNVSLVAGEWNRAFMQEHEEYPYGKYLDQVDSAAGAFNKLAESIGSYDRTLSWVG